MISDLYHVAVVRCHVLRAWDIIDIYLLKLYAFAIILTVALPRHICYLLMIDAHQLHFVLSMGYN